MTCLWSLGLCAAICGLCIIQGTNSELQECEKPPGIENGEITKESIQDKYFIDAKVIYKCKDGFNISGSDESLCLNGQWTAPPVCTEQTCPISRNDVIQYWPFKRIYKVNDVVESVCLDGYWLNGSKLSQCYSYGWNPALPTCEDFRCRISRNDTIQYWPLKRIYKLNDVVKFVCLEGYKLKGATRSQCFSYGWDPALPTCEEDTSESPTEDLGDKPPQPDINCDLPLTGADDDVLRKPSKLVYEINEVVKLSCNWGFFLNGSITSRCSEHGWDPPIPSCRVYECEPPTPIQNGHVKYPIKAANTQGSEVLYECDYGFAFERNRKIAVCKDGRWEMPVCRRGGESCGPPPVIQYGDTVQARKAAYRSGSKVKYQCQHLYVMEGTAVIKCVNGSWGNPPFCLGKEEICLLSQIGWTRLNIKAMCPPGITVEYMCGNNYVMEGKPIIKCENSVWDDPPVCLEPCNIDKREIALHHIRWRWRTDSKPLLRHGEIADFVCLPGYEISNRHTLRVQCIRGELKYPKCIKTGIDNACGPPPYIASGNLQVLSAECKPGSTIEYSCPEFHVLEGSPIVKCKNGFWEDRSLCLEPCTIEEKEMKAHNIRKRGINDSSLYLRHGHFIEFVCLDGYELTEGSLKVLCVMGKMIYPKCKKEIICYPDRTRNGEVAWNKSVYRWGETIKVKCDSGFHLENDPDASPRCTENGWSPPIICTEIICYPDRTRNGEVTWNKSVYRWGETIKVKCDPGFHLENDPDASPRCTENGWFPPIICTE